MLTLSTPSMMEKIRYSSPTPTTLCSNAPSLGLQQKGGVIEREMYKTITLIANTVIKSVKVCEIVLQIHLFKHLFKVFLWLSG